MPLTNPNKIVTEERLNEYHKKILPYLGGNSMVACGGGYAPIGTVIAYMGTRAPSDFLICDGTVYNIADYTELADFFEAQFGSSNFFGGDGTTTFAVPDLRGEFLRGTGTNSHANQGSGANVGVHQDATIHVPTALSQGSTAIAIPLVEGSLSPSQLPSINTADSYTQSYGDCYWYGTRETDGTPVGTFTSRPTNTSVLYCIKAKSQGNGYSLDEQIVGTWIDGKPIYQKSWTGLNINLRANNWYDTQIDATNLVPINGFARCDKTSDNFVFFPHIRNSNNTMRLMYTVDIGTITTLTIQYTKTTD